MISVQFSDNETHFIHEDVAGSEGMFPVFSIHNKETEWKKMLALYSPEDGMFYYLARVGRCRCCDDVLDGISDISQFESGNRKNVKAAVREFNELHPELMTKAELSKIFSKIKSAK